jgi:hypothetical protein
MLILLDIDGVMVPANSWKRPELLSDGFPAFSLKSIASIQKIISETNASILLTTSHKSSYSIEEWKKIFELRGISVENIFRLKNNDLHLNRKEEIMNWVNTSQELPDFIIIDDDKSLNDLPNFIKSRLVQTSASLGLNNELAEEALNIIYRGIHTFA